MSSISGFLFWVNFCNMPFMTYSELTDKNQRVVQFIEENRIHEAMDALGSLVAYCTNRDLSLQLEKHRDTYRSMLKYSFELGDDPEKEKEGAQQEDDAAPAKKRRAKEPA